MCLRDKCSSFTYSIALGALLVLDEAIAPIHLFSRHPCRAFSRRASWRSLDRVLLPSSSPLARFPATRVARPLPSASQPYTKVSHTQNQFKRFEAFKLLARLPKGSYMSSMTGWHDRMTCCWLCSPEQRTTYTATPPASSTPPEGNRPFTVCLWWSQQTWRGGQEPAA